MAPLPPLTPTPPESSGSRVSVRSRVEVSDETIRQSEAALIFVKLRRMIASDTQATDTILGTIAVAAHSLTGATGAAIAMPRDGAVVCVGRSGETAPELGDRLNVDSGISGECLRTGVIMRCDDASRDFHVDAEVCRQLGLQSIAVVPLRGQHGRVGVLEAFSNQSYAFTEDKMELLGRLAGLAEAAWARGAVVELPAPAEDAVGEIVAPVEMVPEAAVPAALPVPLAQVREALAPARDKKPGASKTLRYAALAAGVVVVLALLSVFGWKAWYKASVGRSANQSAGSVQVASAPAEDASAGGSAGQADVVRPAPRPGEAAIQSAAKPGIAVQVVRRPAKTGRAADRGEANAANSSLATPNADELPQVATSSAGAADLGKVFPTAPALPHMSVPVSQGVSGGILVRKVQPVYPQEARRMHVEGKVVIDATVTAQGQVEEVKLVSGDSMLAAAALDAVRKWQYTPYLLNGSPIPKQTRITISFIAPQ